MVEPQFKACPSCLAPADKLHKGEKGWTCEVCGGTFAVIAGETKLTAVGEIDQLKADVKELKERLPASIPAAEPPEQPNETTEDTEEQDDEEDL